MNTGLSIFRVVKSVDPELVGRIHNLEASDAYQRRGIVGIVQMPKETFVNILLPFEYEVSETLGEDTTGFVVLGPGLEVIARAKTIMEAEDIIAHAKVTVDVRVTRGKVEDGAVPA